MWYILCGIYPSILNLDREMRESFLIELNMSLR